MKSKNVFFISIILISELYLLSTEALLIQEMKTEFQKACSYLENEIAKIEGMQSSLPEGTIKKIIDETSSKMLELIQECKADGIKKLLNNENDEAKEKYIEKFESIIEKIYSSLSLVQNSKTCEYSRKEREKFLRLYAHIRKTLTSEFDIIMSIIAIKIIMTPVTKTELKAELTEQEIFTNECVELIESICKANNISPVKLYIGKGTSGLEGGAIMSFAGKTNTFMASHSSYIFLDRDFFNTAAKELIKATIAHELGHIYYNDTGKDAEYCKKIYSSSLKRIYNHFIEHRADLFAAQYGFSKDLKKTLEIGHTPEQLNYWCETHPSTASRSTYLDTIASKNDRSILYEPIYRPRESWFDYLTGKKSTIALKPVENKSMSGKIVNITAQPIRAPKSVPTARTLRTVLNILKKVK